MSPAFASSQSYAQAESAEQCALLIAGSLVIYDYVLTLQQEIDYVWFRKWTPGKILFLSVRYLGLVWVCLCLWAVFTTGATPTACNVIVRLTVCSAYSAYLAGSLVFALRTWAIWNRTRWSAILIGAAWIGNSISTIHSLVVNGILDTLPMEQYAPSLPGCGAGPTPGSFAQASTSGYCYAAYETIIFLLTLARGIRYYTKPTPLMFVLYRDAFVGSLALWAVTMLFAILTSLIETEIAFNFAYFLEVSFYFLVHWRIILNLREATMDLDGWDVTTAARTAATESSTVPATV